jgi:hypothetical protein
MTIPSSLLRPAEISGYLGSTGWQLTTRSRVGELWSHPGFGDFEVLVPLIETASDYEKRLRILVTDLSDLENQPEGRVREGIRYVYSDVTDLKAQSPNIDDTISLQAGYDLFISAKKLVVAAAAATIRRQGHFLRSIPLKARAHAEHVRLGHTRRGSYIVPIISAARAPKPLEADEELTLDIPVEESLFDRRVTVTLAQALGALEELAVRRETVPSKSAVIDAISEGLSYELCAAVREMLRANLVDEVAVNFNWARATHKPTGVLDSMEFPYAAIEVVDRIASALKTAPREREHIVFGVIEDLHDSEDEPDARIGVKAVIDSRPRIIWMDLDKTTYRIALRCHENRQRVIARGILRTPTGREATMDVHYFGPDNALPMASDSIARMD